MNLKEWIGSCCKIIINKDGNNLFFTAKQVLSVSDTHITFIDKFNETYTFNRKYIEEIQEFKPSKGDKLGVFEESA